MDFNIEELFDEFSKNLQKTAGELSVGEFVEAIPGHDHLPNKEEIIEVERPFYLENAIYSAAQVSPEDEKSTAQVLPEDEKNIREKYDLPLDPPDILDLAHPEPVYVADDTYDGGLVENLKEQRRKHMHVVNKMPGGNHVHFASLMDGLVKMADSLEDEGADH